MRVAIFSWETLHAQPVGCAAAHVTELAAALHRITHHAEGRRRPESAGRKAPGHPDSTHARQRHAR